ncbi:uncharacterized protein LOC124459925 [Drosophila willistoni]|uniref:uncharacterized protein LOC124459925 n=1 Tax=Drosophila willistoni TaxID=7260 RepID=UPI001F078283|nr:uncharacterized protein LOC124459925 [Drosophila willistoni]
MRDGNSKEGQTNSSASDFHVGAVKKMLYDDGSAQYKAWLQRTTTLEDIQHQLEQKHAKETTSPVQRRTTGPDSDFSVGLDDTEDGDITGYAFDGIQNASVNYDYPLHIHPGPLIPRYTYRHTIIAPHLKEISKSGYDNSYDDYSVHPPPSDNSHAMSESSKQKKEISFNVHNHGKTL